MIGKGDQAQSRLLKLKLDYNLDAVVEIPFYDENGNQAGDNEISLPRDL